MHSVHAALSMRSSDINSLLSLVCYVYAKVLLLLEFSVCMFNTISSSLSAQEWILA